MLRWLSHKTTSAAPPSPPSTSAVTTTTTVTPAGGARTAPQTTGSGTTNTSPTPTIDDGAWTNIDSSSRASPSSLASCVAPPTPPPGTGTTAWSGMGTGMGVGMGMGMGMGMASGMGGGVSAMMTASGSPVASNMLMTMSATTQRRMDQLRLQPTPLAPATDGRDPVVTSTGCVNSNIDAFNTTINSCSSTCGLSHQTVQPGTVFVDDQNDIYTLSDDEGDIGTGVGSGSGAFSGAVPSSVPGRDSAILSGEPCSMPQPPPPASALFSSSTASFVNPGVSEGEGEEGRDTNPVRDSAEPEPRDEGSAANAADQTFTSRPMAPVVEQSEAVVQFRPSLSPDHTCFALPTKTGYKLFRCEPFGLINEYNFGERIGIVEMQCGADYVALVGACYQPTFPQHKLVFWDYKRQEFLATVEFPHAINSVKLREKRAFVVVVPFLCVYSLYDFQLRRFTISEEGLFAASTGEETTVAFAGPTKGQVCIQNLSISSPLCVIQAHAHALQAIAISMDGQKIATASIQGTRICIWSSEGMVLNKLKRGIDVADIACLNFKPDPLELVVSSNKHTIHIFSTVAQTDLKSWAMGYLSIGNSSVRQFPVTTTSSLVWFGLQSNFYQLTKDALLEFNTQNPTANPTEHPLT
ncbi:WD repeat domain phosphoinositide-interacting 3 [Pelomyxa schiedti]|nr:WD repeat domain phosphoinositide-interacting 3 [Pelomyxa schiedti]